MPQSLRFSQDSALTMKCYFPGVEDIIQYLSSLDVIACPHCDTPGQLVLHGWVHKKSRGACLPVIAARRVMCSERYGRSGCGRTVQLYVAAFVRYLHHLGQAVTGLMSQWLDGQTIRRAYHAATGTADPRNAYRWLARVVERIGTYRSKIHLVAFDETALNTHAQAPPVSARKRLIASTFSQLRQHFTEPLCATYQRVTQTSFL